MAPAARASTRGGDVIHVIIIVEALTTEALSARLVRRASASSSLEDARGTTEPRRVGVESRARGDGRVDGAVARVVVAI